MSKRETTRPEPEDSRSLGQDRADSLSGPDSAAAAPFRALIDCPEGSPVALLHGCGAGPARLFRDPVASLSLGAEGWPDAWWRLEQFLDENREAVTVGWLGYDLRDAVEELDRQIEDDFLQPLMLLAAFEPAGVQEFDAMPAPLPEVEIPHARGVAAHTSRADYERRVAQVVEHIRAGDIFQANLTQPFTGSFDGDPRALFWRLCHASPAPFCAYLEDGYGSSVLSSSPEEFLWRDGAEVRSRPIKGTRPRGADAGSDQALLAELLASEKDQAELAMIVDLMRNDLGKVAEIGSVHVGEFPEHDSFAQVHHLFATVTARLGSAVTTADLLQATFPPGSITGAPKLRCMEILEQLELVRRGIYTGAIGWFGPGDRCHLNVAIRTLSVAGGRVRGNVGGGITADSDPAAEYDETLHKAAGMLRALGAELEVPK